MTTDLFEIRDLLRDHFRKYFTNQGYPELKVFLQHEINNGDPKAVPKVIETTPAVHLIVRSSRITDLKGNHEGKALCISIEMNATIGTRDQLPLSPSRASSEYLGIYLHLVYSALLDFKHSKYTVALEINAPNRMMFSETAQITYCAIPFEVTTVFIHKKQEKTHD